MTDFSFGGGLLLVLPAVAVLAKRSGNISFQLSARFTILFLMYT